MQSADDFLKSVTAKMTARSSEHLLVFAPSKIRRKRIVNQKRLNENSLETLVSLIEHYAETDGVHETLLPRVSFIRVSRPSEPIHVLHEPALCMIVQGSKEVVLGEQRFIYDPTKYLVIAVTLPLTGEILEATPQHPYLCFRLNLDPVLLNALITDSGHCESLHGHPTTGLALNAPTPELLGAVVRLLGLLETPEDIAVLAPLAEREILYRIMKNDTTGMLHQIAAGDSKLQQVNRAVTWLKHNYREPFSIETLTKETHMSPSTLHHHFKTVTGLSPLQYQKQLRLQEARRLLIAQTVDAATAGHTVGYESPSQFSREYKRLFGASPLHDVARQPRLTSNDSL
jgi:AraC-like DNA-binding protein